MDLHSVVFYTTALIWWCQAAVLLYVALSWPPVRGKALLVWAFGANALMAVVSMVLTSMPWMQSFLSAQLPELPQGVDALLRTQLPSELYQAGDYIHYVLVVLSNTLLIAALIVLRSSIKVWLTPDRRSEQEHPSGEEKK